MTQVPTYWLVVPQWDDVALDFVPIAVLPSEERAIAEMIARDRPLYPKRPESAPSPIVKRTSAQLARWLMAVHLDLHDPNRRTAAADVPEYRPQIEPHEIENKEASR